MLLTDFIRLQDPKLIESANITFKLFLPMENGGKWFFYCENGDTVDDLCKWVKDTGIDIELVWPDNQLEIEENGEDKDGRLIVKYIFRRD